MKDESEYYIRQIRKYDACLAIKDILLEEAFKYIKTEVAVGERIIYKIILLNYEDLALQDIEVTFIKS